VEKKNTVHLCDEFTKIRLWYSLSVVKAATYKEWDVPVPAVL